MLRIFDHCTLDRDPRCSSRDLPKPLLSVGLAAWSLAAPLTFGEFLCSVPLMVLLLTAAFFCCLSTITMWGSLATTILFSESQSPTGHLVLYLWRSKHTLLYDVTSYLVITCFLEHSISNSRLDTSCVHIVPSFRSGYWYGWLSGSLLKGAPSCQQVGDADDYVNRNKIHRPWWLFVRICFVIEKLISFGPVSILW